MKGVLIFVVSVIIAGLVFWFVKVDVLSNDSAERDKNGRYLTIVNETKQVINEVHVMVDSGTEIESMNKNNIDKKSFSIKIPKDYKEYNTFRVVLVDRYDTEYEKTISNVKRKGRTEVVINKDNVVKESDGIKKQIDRLFNGD